MRARVGRGREERAPSLARSCSDSPLHGYCSPGFTAKNRGSESRGGGALARANGGARARPRPRPLHMACECRCKLPGYRKLGIPALWGAALGVGDPVSQEPAPAPDPAESGAPAYQRPEMTKPKPAAARRCARRGLAAFEGAWEQRVGVLGLASMPAPDKTLGPHGGGCGHLCLCVCQPGPRHAGGRRAPRFFGEGGGGEGVESSRESPQTDINRSRTGSVRASFLSLSTSQCSNNTTTTSTATLGA